MLIVSKEDELKYNYNDWVVLVYEDILQEIATIIMQELLNNYDCYFLKYALQQATKSEITTLVAGSSYTRFGIEETQLPHAKNCSLFSQDLYYATKIFKHVCEQNRSIRNIVLGLGYYSFF